MQAPYAEISRYLGYKGSAPDQQTKLLIDECYAELMQVATPRAVSKQLPAQTANNKVIICNHTIDSPKFAKHLGNIESVYLLCITLGIGVDKLLLTYSKTHVTKQVIMQACAAAAIEDFADQQEDEITKKVESQGLFTRKRFSPGYGDVSLEHQPWILNQTQATKLIGIELTDSLMLRPSKSVTAIIGVSKTKSCVVHKCDICTQTNCAYKQNN